jgi:proteic killer suppression protein
MIIKLTLRLLDRVDEAHTIEDLRIPPSNRLEKLKGKTPERWSIRVNKQYRITFVWTGTDAEDVAFEDYH